MQKFQKKTRNCCPRTDPVLRGLIEGKFVAVPTHTHEGTSLNAKQSDTDELLRRAEAGDLEARNDLLQRYRRRLRHMVDVHLNQRLSTRVDPSDIVQDALIDAAEGLSEYIQHRPLPFYPWLRQFAWNRLVDMHRRHTAGKRDVRREVDWHLSDVSACDLAQRLVGSGTSPSAHVNRAELSARVREILSTMRSHDCQVLILRHLEELSTAEIANVIGISEEAVKKRHVRALLRLQKQLADISGV